MFHVLASIGFSILTIGTFAYIGLTLLAASPAIRQALGFGHAPVQRAPHHPVRVRSAGRWQSVHTATQPKRAAA